MRLTELPPNHPPAGFGLEECDLSELSTTTAFNNAVDQRDKFLGEKRCVICGWFTAPRHCHIITRTERKTWTHLRHRGWIPSQAKNDPTHEPRNSFLLCPFHHATFGRYYFFIRFLPEIQKFVFINYSGHRDFQDSHGKAIALDMKDRHAPFPSLFIIHEMRARGFRPFEAVNPALPDDIAWQDWISSGGLVNDVALHSFQREMPAPDDNDNITVQPQLLPAMTRTNTGGTSSGTRTLVALSADVITDILAATRAGSSWRVCQVEGTKWTGTAQENMEKYLSNIGV